jgi:colanic acid biosynthesis glycosyl transferase WcaI
VKLVVVSPHFTPDLAPTGEVISRVVQELAARDHRIEVVTSLPWYREHKVEPGYEGRPWRYEDTPWGRITRIHPFPASDKRNLLKRGAAFAGFSALAGALGGRGGHIDGVLAVSPPLTLAAAGWAIAKKRRGAFVFNVQDVYPDVAIELGVLRSKRAIAAAHRVERWCYEHADAVTVLSEDLQANVAHKTSDPTKIRLIPNFVDTEWITPGPKENAYRREFGLEGKFVVMYAGNIGLSQGLNAVVEAASALAYEEQVVFVLNGQGAERAGLERAARGLPNIRFVDVQPAGRLPEVLAAADLHLVTLRRGLARTSVPSKTYSILAAGRPLVASVDTGSEVANIVERAGAGVAVPPEDPEALVKAVKRLMETATELDDMGARGRSFVEAWAAPAAIAEAYEELFTELVDRRRSRPAPPGPTAPSTRR